jgi:hypothetical protein
MRRRNGAHYPKRSSRPRRDRGVGQVSVDTLRIAADRGAMLAARTRGADD